MGDEQSTRTYGENKIHDLSKGVYNYTHINTVALSIAENRMLQCGTIREDAKHPSTCENGKG